MLDTWLSYLYSLCTAAGFLLAEELARRRWTFFSAAFQIDDAFYRIRMPVPTLRAEFSLNEQGCLQIWPLLNRLTVS